MKTEFVTLDLWIQLWWVVVTHSQHSEMCFRKSTWKQGFYCMGTYEKEKINIQAANRREEKRQAGCHTSKTGTQLQQTAEITEHGGKRNRRCERCSNKDTDTIRLKLFIAKLVRQFMQSEHICAWILPTLHWNVISNNENMGKLWMKMKETAGPCDGQFRVILYCGRKKPSFLAFERLEVCLICTAMPVTTAITCKRSKHTSTLKTPDTQIASL